PLQVDYRERYHAAGKIPVHNRRRRDNSGPLTDREVLASRVIDRTIRPWLMMGLASSDKAISLPGNIVVNCEVQSYDSRASSINGKKFPVPLKAAACVKLAIQRDGSVVYDPSPNESEDAKFELLYAGTKDRVLMLEFEDPGVSETTVANALMLAQEAILPIIEQQEQLRQNYRYNASDSTGEELMTDGEVAQLLGLNSFEETTTLDEVHCEDGAKLFGDNGEESPTIQNIPAHIHDGTLLSKQVRGRREYIVKSEITRLLKCAMINLRADGRGTNAVRPISATTPIFPDCVHGSSQFSRGETQVICTASIGAPSDGVPHASPYSDSSAFLHYDFPDFSTGTVKSKGESSANRRAIGHGNLAEKAVLPVLPNIHDFPYAVRLTCEVTSSNGSSSMAAACGSTLALLDAGVPLVSPVAGVSVGLTPDSKTLLLDITGTEDHYGDMDFKVCGTSGGVLSMQLDVKNPVTMKVIASALSLAKDGRNAILAAMGKEVGGLHPRRSMKSTAPRIEVVKFDPNRKRDLIGPGGSVLRQLEDRFNVSLDLSQDGLIFGALQAVSGAKRVIMDLVADVEEGGVYEGTVIEIKDFGAVVELLRNKEGLLHVSELADKTEKHPEGNMGLLRDHLKVGDKIEVLCTKIDHVQGSIKLSRKKLLQMRESKYS
ncbi:hypothetical protein THAPSDRAFT_263495, partial [Thalassiosira pseudonana CCMP1335]